MVVLVFTSKVKAIEAGRETSVFNSKHKGKAYIYVSFTDGRSETWYFDSTLVPLPHIYEMLGKLEEGDVLILKIEDEKLKDIEIRG